MNYGTQYFGGSGGLGSGGGFGGSALLLPQNIVPIPLNMMGIVPAGSLTSSGSNVAVLVPFWVPKACKVTVMAFYVNATTGGTVDIGVYKDSGNKGTLAGRLASSGAISVNAGGLWTTSMAVKLEGGDQRYFSVFTTSSTSFVFNGRASIQGQADCTGCFRIAGGGPTLAATLTLAAFGNNSFICPEVALTLVAA